MELMGKQEVCQLLGVCERTLEKMLARCEFPPPLRLGKTARWSREVVEHWLEAKLKPQLEWMPPGSRGRRRAA